MANVLSLALRVTADASQLKLDPVQRALVGLGDQADKLTGQFAKFTGNSEAAAAAQARFGKEAQDLINTLRDGGDGAATQFAAGFERLTQAANEEAAAFERAARIIEANLTPLERFDRAQAELTEQLNAGRIGQETYNRAIESAAKSLSDAERAARGLAVQQKEIDNAAANTTLKFNELSGVFAVLPGPLGNIAGRISGISSASEGLSRVFAGGLRSGITNVASSFTALVNPVTASLAGLAAFGAGATAVARGLVSLEDRVERLGRLANQLGISFEFVQTLEEAGKRTDVSIEQLSGSFARLQNTLAGADEESKKAQAALQRLGVSVQEFGQLSEEQRIELIGERLAQIEDPAQRSAAAIALFGRSGVQLLPFFNELGLAAADMERFGRAVSDLDRARLADFGGSIDALSLATQGLGQSLLLPFTGLGDGIARALAEVTAGITSIIDPIGRVLEPVLTNIGRVVEALGVSLGTIGRIIGAVFEPFAVVVQAVSQAFEPLYDSLLDFQRTLSESVVSVTEWIVSFGPLGAVAANAQAFGETISRVVTIITTAYSQVGEFIGNLVTRFAEFFGLSDSITAIGNTISRVFGGVSEVFSTIANAIGGVVGRLLTIAENFLGIDRSAQAAAEATATLGTEIEALTEEERKLATEREKFLQGFTDNVSKAIDESAKFGQAGFDAALRYQEAIDELQRQFDAGILNETAFARAAEQANETFREQIQILKDSAAETERKAKAEQDAADRAAKAVEEAAQRQQESDRQRIDSLLGASEAASRAAQDIAAIEREIQRVQSEINNAGGASLPALDARLAQLEDLQQAVSQGFAEGLDAAFQNTARGFDSVINKASEFGEAGIDAAARLQEGIALAQQQARDGILNREAYEQEVARQQELFDKELEDIQTLAAERQRINQFVDQQIELARFGGDSARLQASQNAAAIEAEIARVTAEVNAARAAGEQQAVQAGIERLAQLDQAAAKERDIASGKAKEREEQRRAFEEQAKAAQQQQQQFAQQQSQLNQERERALEEQARAAQAEFERQSERIRSLNSVGQQSVGGADLRTNEGASQFIQAAAGAFDPNLAELRAQTKLLRQIFVNSGALQYLERGIGSTVTFLRAGA